MKGQVQLSRKGSTNELQETNAVLTTPNALGRWVISGSPEKMCAVRCVCPVFKASGVAVCLQGTVSSWMV